MEGTTLSCCRSPCGRTRLQCRASALRALELLWGTEKLPTVVQWCSGAVMTCMSDLSWYLVNCLPYLGLPVILLLY